MTQRKTRREIRFTEFRTWYRDDLTTSDRQAALHHLCTVSHRGPRTPLTVTKDVVHSHGAELAELLQWTP